MVTMKISTKCMCSFNLKCCICIRILPVTSAKKSAKPSAFYTFENPQVRRSANPHFTGGLICQCLYLISYKFPSYVTHLHHFTLKLNTNNAQCKTFNIKTFTTLFTIPKYELCGKLFRFRSDAWKISKIFPWLEQSINYSHYFKYLT